MYRMSTDSFSFAATLLLAGMLACGEGTPRDETGGVDGSASAGDTTPVSADTIPSAGMMADLSDANIAALLDHANEADSSAGSLAAKKATNPQVKKFAQMMMADHHQLRKQGADLAEKLNITPQPPPDDPVTPLAQQEMDALKKAEKGPDFDRTYIQQEITAHQAVLDLLDQSHEAAGNAELKALIEKVRPLVENHLEQAKAIDKELGAKA
jgi:putative membrane protein